MRACAGTTAFFFYKFSSTNSVIALSLGSSTVHGVLSVGVRPLSLGLKLSG